MSRPKKRSRPVRNGHSTPRGRLCVPVVIVWFKGRAHRVPVDEARALVAQITENIRQYDAQHACTCCAVHNHPQWIQETARGW